MNKSIIYPILAPHTNCLKKTLIMDYYVVYWLVWGGGGAELPSIRNIELNCSNYSTNTVP